MQESRIQESRCDKENNIKCKTCGKVFYSQSFHDSHIENKKCVEHSYECQVCLQVTFIDDHKCYMQRKELKESSEKYIFFDFETKLAEKNKHILSYCIAHYFNGEYIMNT